MPKSESHATRDRPSRFLLMHWDYEQSAPIAIVDTLDEAKALARPDESIIEFVVGIPCSRRDYDLHGGEWRVWEHPSWEKFLPGAEYGRVPA